MKAEEMALSLTSCDTQESRLRIELALVGGGPSISWPCPLPAAALGRAGPIPYLDSTAELTLVVGAQVNPELVPKFVCCTVTPLYSIPRHLRQAGALDLES